MSIFLKQVANPIVRGLLRSPLHLLLSRAVMLITVTGRRTGTRYTLPVQYVRRGDTIYAFSPGDRRWWRNLIGGAPVTLRLVKETLIGVGDVLRGAAADEARAELAGTSLAKSAQRFPGGVIVRVRLDPTGKFIETGRDPSRPILRPTDP